MRLRRRGFEDSLRNHSLLSITLQPRLWRLDLLEDPHWHALALADAIDSDLLFISARKSSSLTARVENWMSSCLSRKAGAKGAVVALLGQDGQVDKADGSRLQFLRRAAAAAGLDFFAPQLRPDDSADLSIEEIHRRAEAFTPTLEDILGT